MHNVIGFFIGAFLSYFLANRIGLIFYLGVTLYVCLDDMIDWLFRKTNGDVPSSKVNTTNWEE